MFPVLFQGKNIFYSREKFKRSFGNAMKKNFLFGIVVFTLFAAVFAFLGTTIMQTNAAGNPRRVIVTFDTPVNEAAYQSLVEKGGRVVKELPLTNGVVVLLPTEAAVSDIGALSGVKRVESDIRIFALKPPSGCTPWPDCKNGGGTEPPPPPQTLEWGVDRIDSEIAWAASSSSPSSRGTGIRIAVIDTGIDKDHADLTANLKGGINFVSKGGSPWNPKPTDPSAWDDDNGHGTHVAGIISARDNSIGVVGVAPEADLYAVKVLDRNGSGYLSDVVEGIDWAVTNDMQVINMSLGTASDMQTMHDAVDAAYAAGVVVVAAAGNSGDGDGSTNNVTYPAKYESVIAVAATASDDAVPYWSSDGGEVELAAPGVDIRSTWNDGGYNTISGTSMASPHVAGVAALVLATPILAAYDANGDGGWDPTEVRAVLAAASDDLGVLGRDVFYGYGLVDAEESVTGNQANP